MTFLTAWCLQYSFFIRHRDILHILIWSINFTFLWIESFFHGACMYSSGVWFFVFVFSCMFRFVEPASSLLVMCTWREGWRLRSWLTHILGKMKQALGQCPQRDKRVSGIVPLKLSSLNPCQSLLFSGGCILFL